MLLINKVNINAQVQHFQCCAETLFILNYFIFNHAFVGWCVSMSASACRDKKGAPGPLELESQADVSCPRWVLGTTLSSSVRAASTANHWATFPSLEANFNSSKCYFVLGVAGCMGVHSMKCGRLEDNLQELVLTFDHTELQGLNSGQQGRLQALP